MSQKARNIIGWILTVLLACLFFFSGFLKLSGNTQTMQAATMFSITAAQMKFFGALEIISVILFIIPRTGLLGTLLLSAYIGGAIATHLEHHIPYNGPIIIQCIIWITAIIRFPELSKRLIG